MSRCTFGTFKWYGLRYCLKLIMPKNSTYRWVWHCMNNTTVPRGDKDLLSLLDHLRSSSDVVGFSCVCVLSWLLFVCLLNLSMPLSDNFVLWVLISLWYFSPLFFIIKINFSSNKQRRNKEIWRAVE